MTCQNKFRLLALSIFFSACGNSQSLLDNDSATCVAFYNVENLFDTYDDKYTFDEEFTPEGSKKWTKKRYEEKLSHLSKVLFEIGTDYVSSGASLIGLAEIENKKVLQDLINKDSLANRNLNIIQYPSPDKRGIDVALLYNKDKFHVISSNSIKVNGFKSNGKKLYTRDILKVLGILGQDTIVVFVNHWPSRRSGKENSAGLRKISALTLKAEINKTNKKHPNMKCIVMGDFNDNPLDASISKHLGTVSKIKQVQKNNLFNPFVNIYKSGEGTTPYKGDWFLFDQIMVNKALIENKGLTLHQSGIFKAPYLFQKGGKYDGYILRNYAGNKYLHGYSDHLPVYSIFKK